MPLDRPLSESPAAPTAPLCLQSANSNTAPSRLRSSERALRLSEERLGLVLQTLPVVIYTAPLGTPSGASWISDNIEQLTGYPARRLLEEPRFWHERIHPDDRERVLAGFEQARDTGTVELEYRWQVADGSYRWFHDFAVARKIDDAVKEVIGTFEDITARHRAEEARERQAARLAVVSQVARRVASILDRPALFRAAVEDIQKGFGYHNVALLHLDGANRRLDWQAMAGAFATLASPAYTQSLDEGLIGLAARTGQTVVANDVLQDPHYIVGFPCPVPVRSEVAVPVKLGEQILAVLDVQERHVDAFDPDAVQTLEILAEQLAVPMENARRYARPPAELEPLAADPTDPTLRLRPGRRRALVERAECLRHLAAGVAHGFNNGLTAILGNLELAQLDLPATAPAAASIREALAATRNTVELSRRVLAVSGRIWVQPEPVFLPALIEDLQPALRGALPANSRLNLVPGDASLPPAFADPSRVRQILMHVVTFTGESLGSHPGTVTIRTRLRTLSAQDLAGSHTHPSPPPGDFVTIQISDDGIGMDARTLEHLFEPFFLAGDAGRGLGLAMAAGLVSAQHGVFFAECELGRGTRFEICLRVPPERRPFQVSPTFSGSGA